MTVLFVGDIVKLPRGRWRCSRARAEWGPFDFIVANVENAAGGSVDGKGHGRTVPAGVGRNDKRQPHMGQQEALPLLDAERRLVRPAITRRPRRESDRH